MNEDIQKVIELEIELLQPETRKSVKRLHELLADDFFEFMQNGLSTNKQLIIDYLPTSPEENFNIRNMESKVLSEKCILLYYIADREVIESGEKKTTLCSSIWRKEEGIWQMIFFQGTPAKE